MNNDIIRTFNLKVVPATMTRHGYGAQIFLGDSSMNIVTDNTSGIYEIRNTINGHRYIGSATNLKSRWSHHQYRFRLNKHHNKYLQRAWNKYGSSVFVFSVLETCSVSNLIEREQYYIDIHKPEYNICKTAGSTLGRRLTEGAKKKLSEFFKGNQYAKGHGHKKSEEERQKISKAHKGRVFTEEHCRNISKSKTPEMRERLAQANRERVWTIEQREKMARISEKKREQLIQRNKERVWTPEARQKISRANTGRIKTPEEIEKSRQKNIGRKASPETLEKLRRAKQAWWDRKKAEEE